MEIVVFSSISTAKVVAAGVDGTGAGVVAAGVAVGVAAGTWAGVAYVVAAGVTLTGVISTGVKATYSPTGAVVAVSSLTTSFCTSVTYVLKLFQYALYHRCILSFSVKKYYLQNPAFFECNKKIK